MIPEVVKETFARVLTGARAFPEIFCFAMEGAAYESGFKIPSARPVCSDNAQSAIVLAS